MDKEKQRLALNGRTVILFIMTELTMTEIDIILNNAILFLKEHWVITFSVIILYGLFGDMIKDKLLR